MVKWRRETNDEIVVKGGGGGKWHPPNLLSEASQFEKWCWVASCQPGLGKRLDRCQRAWACKRIMGGGGTETYLRRGLTFGVDPRVTFGLHFCYLKLWGVSGQGRLPSHNPRASKKLQSASEITNSSSLLLTHMIQKGAPCQGSGNYREIRCRTQAL